MSEDLPAEGSPDDFWHHLVEELSQRGILKTEHIRSAFLKWGRHRVIDPEDLEGQRMAAGLDHALEIGYGRTMSQPRMVALMTELLEPKEGEIALDVGLGSGWQTIILRVCVGVRGRVIAIERIGALFERTRVRLENLGLHDIQLIHGDGMNPADIPEGPFDMITCAAGSPDAPVFWKERLKEGGRIVYPKQVGEIREGTLYLHDGSEMEAQKWESGPMHRLCRTVRSGSVFTEDFHAQLCRYVPLTEGRT